MAGLIFYFEENDIDVYSGRRIDLDAWNYALKLAGDIDKAIIINRTEQNLQTFDAGMNIQFVSEMPEVSDNVVYLICPWNDCENKTSLWDFDHDVDWYAFGPASGWGDKVKYKNGVYIPQSGIAACHSTHIATVVMAHRYKVINGS